jgi:hypothetical protein
MAFCFFCAIPLIRRFILRRRVMSDRQFKEQLNKGLDKIGVPQPELERIAALAQILKISLTKAGALMQGNTRWVDSAIMEKLAYELELDLPELLGDSHSRSTPQP